MSTHFVDLKALHTYSEKSRNFLEWIVENYDEDNDEFIRKYLTKLEELHKLNKLI